MQRSGIKAPQHLSRFQSTVERLTREVYDLRRTFAAMHASGRGHPSNHYLQVASRALFSDVLIRLIRIFERGEAAAFWYLYRCESAKVSARVDIEALKGFSARLKRVRDKVFVHIDKDAVFEPQKVYQEANLRMSEIVHAIEAASTVLNALYIEQNGESFMAPLQQTLRTLSEDFRRDLAELTER